MEFFLSVEQAAKLLGVSPMCVRLGLQQGTLPIGAAVKMNEWRYIIPWKRFSEFTGIYRSQKDLSSLTDILANA